MPLIKSNKPANVAKNISEFHTGERYAQTSKKFGKKRADEQAIAVALDIAKKVKERAYGGPLSYSPPIYAAPGNIESPPAMKSGGSMDVAFKAKGNIPKVAKYISPKVTRGPIISSVPGRTDAHATHVPSGSYVIPADIVSGRGEGNTLAGVKSLQRMFKMGPQVKPYGKTKSFFGGPAFKSPKIGKKDGGRKSSTHNIGVPVRVNLAGGEIVIPPENLLQVVHHDLGRAHAMMDAWIKSERGRLRQTLAKLPGPAKD